LQPTGQLIVNSTDQNFLPLNKKNRLTLCPANSLAEPLGKKELANAVLLGLAVKILGLADWRALDKALAQKFSGTNLKLNRQAARLGYDQKF